MKPQSLLLVGLVVLAGPMCLSGTGQALAAQDEQNSSATQNNNAPADATLNTTAASTHLAVTPGQVFKDCPDCPEMVVVPAGSFVMGLRFGLGDGKIPVRQAAISRSFALGRSVVTQGQWRAIMGVNPRKFNNCGDDCPCGDSCPVGSASWDDIQAFIRLLNKKTGKQYRLPSEVEWEYAFGLRNMTGLFDTRHPVFEWVERSLPALRADAQTGQQNDEERIIRGGLWLNTPDLLHEAIRGGPDSALRANRLGLRLARTLPHAGDASLDAVNPAVGQMDAVTREEKAPPQIDRNEVLNEAQRAGLPLTIYQPYDTLRTDFSPYHKKIRAIVDFLTQHPSAALILEGNTDERGTNEMNFAIGQRYADSVKKYLLTQGVEASRIDTVSAGEEKPADSGHTEKAWAKNRRVVIRLRLMEGQP